MKSLQKILSYWPFFLVEFLLLWTAIDLDSNKFDTGFKIHGLFVFGVVTPLLVFSFLQKKREQAEQAGLETVFLLSFLGWVMLSFLGSDIKNYGLSEVVILGCMVILYLALARTEIRWREWFLQSVVMFGVISVAVGYYLYFTRPEERMVGLFFGKTVIAQMWPNAFAFFILLVWPVAFLFLLKKSSWLESFFLAFLLSGLFLSYSRAAFLAFMGQIVLAAIYFLISKRSSIKIMWPKFLLVAVLCFLFVFTGNQIRRHQFATFSFVDKAKFTTAEQTSSINERRELMRGGLKLALQKPLFGYGPFSFRSIYPSVQKHFLAYSDHPHNWLIKIAVENGLPALLFSILFLGAVFLKVIQKFSSLDEQNRDLVYLLSVSIIGAMAHSMVDYNLNFLNNVLLFWMFVAIIRSGVNEYKRYPETKLHSAPLRFASVGMTQKNIVFFLIAFSIILATAREAYYSYVLARPATNLFFANEHEQAFSLAKQYEKAWFPRNYFLTMGWWSMERKQPDLAEKYLQIQIKKNPYEAEAYKLLGELAGQKNNYAEALDYYEKALELDPMNHFVHYYRVFELLQKLGRTPEIKERQAVILGLLANYEDQVRYNVHFTAVHHDNVDWSLKLYELLSVINPERREEFKEKAKRIKELAEKQREKFKEISEYWKRRGVSIQL